jgi:(1->4)-alpha-D-glucan 1-alpha-D-glucosylmutase
MLRRVGAIGMLNSLSQVVLKLGSPGVPDFYQGSELWDLSLVDPDNRRPVDFDLRRALLDDVDRVLALCPTQRVPALAGMLRDWVDGRIKLLTTTAGLRLRRKDPELFLSGAYVPLATEITVDGDAIAFARMQNERAQLFVAPRLCARLFTDDLQPPVGAAWKTSRILLPRELAGRRFRHELTGAELHSTSTADESWLFLGEIFEHVPVGILSAI